MHLQIQGTSMQNQGNIMKFVIEDDVTKHLIIWDMWVCYNHPFEIMLPDRDIGKKFTVGKTKMLHVISHAWPCLAVVVWTLKRLVCWSACDTFCVIKKL